MLLLFVTLNFQFEFETANQLGFEPRSSEQKVAIPTIELQSIDKVSKISKKIPIGDVPNQSPAWKDFHGPTILYASHPTDTYYQENKNSH